jgi:hypothetical protein
MSNGHAPLRLNGFGHLLERVRKIHRAHWLGGFTPARCSNACATCAILSDERSTHSAARLARAL